MSSGWYIYWAFALVFAALVLFAIPEYVALKHRGATFSRFMAYMGRDTQFGMIWTFMWGMLVGGLLVHFSGWCIGPCL